VNHVQRDLARLNAEFHRLGAVVTYDDGFVGIDPDKAPADLLRLYAAITSYGYANGLLP
jgi:hypothetical protein